MSASTALLGWPETRWAPESPKAAIAAHTARRISMVHPLDVGYLIEVDPSRHLYSLILSEL